MGLGYILLIAFGTYAALKFYATQRQIAQTLSAQGVAAPGVSTFQPIPVVHRVQQIQAYAPLNSCSTVQYGYAPAFGPVENMPASCQEIFYP